MGLRPFTKPAQTALAGGLRFEAARQASVTPQIVRDWGVCFNANGPDGLIDRPAPGRAPKLNAEPLGALLARVGAGPMPAVDGVVRWRLVDLVQWVFEEFCVSLSSQTMSRGLLEAGYRKLSARPRHQGQDPDAIETFKRLPRRAGEIRATLKSGTPIEIWWQDEARVGQKNSITRLWAKRGTRPSEGPENQIRLSVRSDLSQGRQGSWPRHAALRYLRHEPPPH